jgi:hypothetical protein
MVLRMDSKFSAVRLKGLKSQVTERDVFRNDRERDDPEFPAHLMLGRFTVRMEESLNV